MISQFTQVQIVHGTFTKYLPGIAGVSKQGMPGRAAVEIVEGGANTIPDPKQNPLLAAVARHLQQASANYVCHPQKSTIRMPYVSPLSIAFSCWNCH